MVGGALAIDKLSVENALKELKKEQERTVALLVRLPRLRRLLCSLYPSRT